MNAQDFEKNYTYRQLRKMYTAAARQARAAYREISAKYPQSDVTQIYRGDFKGFTTISKGGLKKTDLAKQLASVERYLSGSASSLEKYERRREQTIETFKRHGYDVNEYNLDDVQEFFKDMTDRGIKAIYGSDLLLTSYTDLNAVYGGSEVVEALGRAQKRGLTEEQLKANIKYWRSNIEAVEAGRRSGKLRVYSKLASNSDSFNNGYKR